MTYEQYFLIGVAIWVVGIIALPVYVGYQKAKDAEPSETLMFMMVLFLVLVIPFWGFVIVGAIVLAIGYPIVRLLVHAGTKLAGPSQ